MHPECFRDWEYQRKCNTACAMVGYVAVLFVLNPANVFWVFAWWWKCFPSIWCTLSHPRVEPVPCPCIVWDKFIVKVWGEEGGITLEKSRKRSSGGKKTNMVIAERLRGDRKQKHDLEEQLKKKQRRHSVQNMQLEMRKRSCWESHAEEKRGKVCKESERRRQKIDRTSWNNASSKGTRSRRCRQRRGREV